MRQVGKLGVWYPVDRLDRAGIRGLLRTIEDLGYSTFWYPEALGYESLSIASFMLANTTRLIIGSSIANIYARDPFTARHIRNVPGRKTDVKDSEWIADLVRHGLIAKSFVPPKPLRGLRELLRYRRKLTESQAADRNRLLKFLETANIKLASAASDVFGVSDRAMLRALIAGEASP